jgi:O-antigen ligase
MSTVQPWRPLWRGVLFSIFLSGIVITESRGALVLLLLVLLVQGLLRNRKGFLVLAVGLVVIGAVAAPVRSRFTNELVGGQLVGSYGTRALLRELALRAWDMSPWFGYGSGHFFSVLSPAFFGFSYEAHSDWLKFLVDTGIVGFVLYTGVFLAVWSCLHPGKGHVVVAARTLLPAFWLYGSVDVLHRLVTVQAYFWTLVGVALAHSASALKEHQGAR